MFDVGGAGKAIILVSAMAGLAIVGPLWLAYASHCFLTVLTESSTGLWEVNWPDESVGDWWWKPLYCVAILAFWMSAGALILAPLLLLNLWLFAAAGGLFLWYAYPISLMGVLDAGNTLAVFHVPLFLRLGRHLPALLFVGLITLPAAALAVGLLVLVFRQSTLWALPASLLVPPAVLFYGRCWGRLAWLALNRKARATTPVAELPPNEAASAVVHDPWALPQPDVIPEVEVEVEDSVAHAPEPADDNEWADSPAPYVVSTSLASNPEPGSSRPDRGGAASKDDGPLFSATRYYEEYRKSDEERAARAEGRKPNEKRRRRATFRTAFGADLWAFFVQFRTIRAGVSLAALTFALLLLVCVVRRAMF